MTLTNRPGETGDGTDPSGIRRSRPRLDRSSTLSSDPRHEGGEGPLRPRTRPIRTSPAIITNGDVLAPDSGLAPGSFDGGDAAPKVDLAALVTAAVPVVERESVPEVVPVRPAAPLDDDLIPTSAVARTAASVAAPPLPAEPVRGAGSAPASKSSRSIVGRRRRPRVRRVRRVVRSVDTWTVFKVSTLFYLVAYAIVLVAGVLLWNLAYATGTIENLQDFFTDFGWETFTFEGGQIFHSAWIVGLFLVIAGIGLNVTLATVFNLIADLVGGIGVTVLEEEVRVIPQASPPAE